MPTATKDSQMTFRLPASLKEQIEEIAEREDRKAGDLVCSVLEGFADGTGDMPSRVFDQLARHRPMVAAAVMRLISHALANDGRGRDIVMLASGMDIEDSSAPFKDAGKKSGS